MQLGQIKSADSLETLDINNLCILLSLKFLEEFKWLDFEKYDGTSCPYTHLKVYGLVMAQYENNDKLLIQTFP